MLTAVGAGAVGGGVAFSDAGFRQILGFFGTWILVCGGLIGLFRQGDRLMRPESRTAISDWLLGENFAEKASGWPETFTSLFDAVFTEDHFSWTCFWRSSLVSVSIVTTGMVAVYTVTGLPSGSVDRATYLFSTIVAINLIVDYLSLYQTRWLLGQIKKTSRLSSWLIFVVVDLLATTACVLVPYTINGLFVTAGDTLSGLSVWSLDFWRLLSKEAVDYAGGMLKASIEPQPAAVIFASSFVTSVWLWLYVGAGLLLKTLRPVLDSLDWLKHLLDVERRPADAMGFLLAVLVSVGFAISAPFLL